MGENFLPDIKSAEFKHDAGHRDIFSAIVWDWQLFALSVSLVPINYKKFSHIPLIT